MIHTANCGDFDKISKRSYSDRVDWVSNIDLIRAWQPTDEPDGVRKVDQCRRPVPFPQACAEVVAAVDYGSPEYLAVSP